MHLGLIAQTVYIAEPKPNQPLKDEQPFIIDVLGATPEHVDFYLNDSLVATRAGAPFEFQVSWNTKLENRVRVVAHFPDREAVVIEQLYAPLRVDEETTVLGFQVFPFFDRNIGEDRPRFTSRDQPLEPQHFEPAFKHRLDLVILLDTSGSMRHALEPMTSPFRAFLKSVSQGNARVRVVLFDRQPRLVDTQQVLELDTLDRLYKSEGKSIIWDSLATAAAMYGRFPRRMILLLSDGYDDGSRHTAETASVAIYKAGAVLIWLNPTQLPNRDLVKLSERSGGFALFGPQVESWVVLVERLNHQYSLLAPDATYPIEIDLSRTKIWYPRWDQ